MPEGQKPAHVPPLHEGTLAPDDVARRSFSTTFRGYDQHEVRGFLTRVAAEVRMLLDRERELRRRLDAVERHRPPPAPAAEPDEQQLITALGAEAARVIQAAREAAVEIRSKAEEHVGRLVREAQDEAARVRTEAEQLLEIRTADAEQAAEAIRGEAGQEADAEIERARARGREMVAEAQAVRERLLRDLARRRRTAHAQIEQLRAGRDRLLDAYRVVRQTLEDATSELARAEPEARAAAESAALRAAGEPEPTVEEMEAELATARGSDLTAVFDPQPAGADHAPHPDTPEAPGAPDAPESPTSPDASGDARPTTGERPATPPTTTPAAVPPPDEARPAEREPVANGAAGSAEPVGRGERSAHGEAPPEERRSSLRLLRRRRAEQAVPEGEVSVVDPGDAVEGVRILRPGATPTTDAPGAGSATGEAEPEGAGPPLAGRSDEGADGDAGDPTAAAAAAGGPVDHEREPGDVAGGEHRPASVEELFARIRAERAESVAHAEEVLGRGDADGPPTGEHLAGGEAATGEVAPDAAGAGDAGDQAPPEEEAPAPAAADEALLEQRDARIEPIERQATRTLKRALADEQNAVLDRLRRHSGAPTVDVLLADGGEQAERYAAAVRDALVDAARAGTVFAGGDEAGAGHVDVDDLVTAGTAELAAGLRDRVAVLVEDAGDAGEHGLTMRLSSVYRELKTQRAEAFVRDAVVAAFNRGIYAAVPDGVTVRWVVDFDGKPCPDGDDNALAGPIAKGDAFPTGQCLPPAHAGCRCVLVRDTL